MSVCVSVLCWSDTLIGGAFLLTAVVLVFNAHALVRKVRRSGRV